jgi:sarcosine oxidase, subunit gamma
MPETRTREMEWPPARGQAELLIERQRLTARRLGGVGQVLISGDLGAAVAALAPGAPMLGLYALAPEEAHGLRIGRTSALLVTPAPLTISDGWRDGWCATCVDDGWAAVEVRGEDAGQALMQATSADLASGSPSAAVLVFGLRGLLARRAHGFRVHVESPWLETLAAWLDGV